MDASDAFRVNPPLELLLGPGLELPLLVAAWRASPTPRKRATGKTITRKRGAPSFAVGKAGNGR
jgi:hypothetical protein